ncbi:hypothetical protein ABIB00_002147 [Bradyrhizobium sp. LB14.3]
MLDRRFGQLVGEVVGLWIVPTSTFGYRCTPGFTDRNVGRSPQAALSE